MTKQQTKPYENSRISGQQVHTVLSSLPDRFTFGPHTRAMSTYLSRRWRATSYGWWKRQQGIEYNREWTPESQSRAMNPDRYRWVEHPADSLRFVGNAHEIRGSGDGNMPYFDRSLVDHTGWFTNRWQDETVCGQVYQLPARNGESIYVPAISDPNSDGAIIDFHSGTADITEAIRWSDSMAEKYAEAEREYQEREDAKSRMEEIDGEVQTARADFKTLAQELRANCDKLTGMLALRKLIRAEYRRMRAECRELLREKRKLAENL